MVTKLEAAKMVIQAGIPCVLANGWRDRILMRLFEGEEVGTLFVTRREKAMKSRYRWLAFTTRPKGIIVVDEGARRALIDSKKSLLASGITQVGGEFEKGDLVRIVDQKNNEFARGIVNFDWVQLGKVKGLKSHEIQKMLGATPQPEVIHRDKLVIL
jgi:glutamate 5-kinase